MAAWRTFRIAFDNTGGALSGPSPADGFVDPTPPARYAGFADDARRDAKERAWLRWQRLLAQLATVGDLLGAAVESRSSNGPNAEEDSVVLLVTYDQHGGIGTDDETGGGRLEDTAAVRRAAARVFAFDQEGLIAGALAPATGPRSVTVHAAGPFTGDVATRLAAAEAQITVTVAAG